MIKSRIAIAAGLVVAAASAFSFDVLDDNGKAGKTGSPGEQTCQTTCHTGAAVNDGIGSVTISSPDMTNWEYMPGDTYNISVKVKRTGTPLFGFATECLTMQSVPNNAGLFLNTIPSQTHILSATVNTVSRKSITHQLNAGLTNDSMVYTFNWIAPSSNVGNATFYVAGNAANNNGAKTGDFIYTVTQLITPAFGASINETTAQTEFNVFPNPVAESINLRFIATGGERINFTLHNAEGKLVHTFPLVIADGGKEELAFAIPSELNAGLYILSMHRESGTAQQTIIIR
ncbi:MAG: T9SS type A sorting domain-containing protein [Bacteroidia bacterium]|nr:T9SS type A sorting domain-containing protein [Bacteroidia bacterium]